MLTLHPYDKSTYYGDGSYALLPDQLQTYLSTLVGFPALQRLSMCDPYDGQRFSVEESIEFREELRQFAEKVEYRTVPVPPDHISNSPGEGEDEEYGWKGIELFCEQFQTVLDDGITANVGIVSLGD